MVCPPAEPIKSEWWSKCSTLSRGGGEFSSPVPVVAAVEEEEESHSGERNLCRSSASFAGAFLPFQRWHILVSTSSSLLANTKQAVRHLRTCEEKKSG
jgi:hypothetical protein